MNDRTEKEPPNVAIESEKSERASESRGVRPTDYGGGRKYSGGMVRPDPCDRKREEREGRRDEMRGIDGQKEGGRREEGGKEKCGRGRRREGEI